MERRNLKVFRIMQGLTQEEMAEKLGVTRVFYSNVENGKNSTSYKFLKKLQKTFDLSDEEVWKLSKTGVDKVER